MALVYRMYIPENISIPTGTYTLEGLIVLLSDQNIELKYLDKIRSNYYLLFPYDVMCINTSFLFLDNTKKIIYNKKNFIPSCIMFGPSNIIEKNENITYPPDPFIHYAELFRKHNLDFQVYDLIFNYNFMLVDHPQTNTLPVIMLNIDDTNVAMYDDFIVTKKLETLSQMFKSSNIDFHKIRYGTIIKLREHDYSNTYIYTCQTILQSVGNGYCANLLKDNLEITGLAKYLSTIKTFSGIVIQLPNERTAKVYFNGDTCVIKFTF
jgi:hypothetical protein